MNQVMSDIRHLGKRYGMEMQFLEVRSSVDGALLGKVPALSKEEVDKRMHKAKHAFSKWSHTTLSERLNILYKTAELLEQNREELAELLLREVGKSKKSAESEVIRTAALIRHTADTAKTIYKNPRNGDNLGGYKKGKFAMSHRIPLGLVLAISPFHYPVNLAASQIAPALAMGNTVVLKPASVGCLSGLYLVKMFQKAGVPEDVLQTVTGKGNEVGDYAVTHPLVDFIHFVGSTYVGQKIAEKVSVVPTLMELGGKSTTIIFEDADLDVAAKHIVGEAFSYSGQHCSAVKCVLVMEFVHDKLISKIAEYMKLLVVGNPLEVNADVVPLISEKSADFVWNMIQDSLGKGGKLITGGKREGNLIQPTLIDQVTADMNLVCLEVFGPVLPIITVHSEEEAVSITNRWKNGFQASLFTRDINRAFLIAEELDVGVVQINGKTERGPEHLPFIGMKSSGVAVGEMRYSLNAMSRMKSTIVNLTIV